MIPISQRTLTSQVRAFHAAFGLPISNSPTPLGETRVLARAAWLREEIEEFAAAITLVQQVDAVVDVIYLAAGCLVEMGVELNEVFDAVHEANMAKRWPDGSVHMDTQGKVEKPPGWIGPEKALTRVLHTPEGEG